MKSSKRHTILFFVILAALPLLGCAGLHAYGSLRLLAGGKEGVTMERLVDRWQDYDIYYSGIAVHKPSAILFDPKGDEKTLQVHPWWVRVEKKDMLLEILKWMDFYRRFPPRLRAVLGPDNAFFGYMYTPWDHALIKVVDDKTLWVNELSMPRDEASRDGAGGSVGSLR
jgi:hypothetical protein